MLTQVFPERDSELEQSLYAPFKVDMQPRLAAALLRRISVHQRMQDSNKVDEFAVAILEGQWEPDDNTDPIRIGINGEIVNGQHRLTAILRSGRIVPVWVQLDTRPTLF